ncbi:GH116 family glycosyl-hydrolase, partial [Nevskia soli]|uniref:GH116 family glycosyl-hydrolase n=1 Tax=Nevskia soli TaxID=418856 RepID=UPI0015D80699
MPDELNPARRTFLKAVVAGASAVHPSSAQSRPTTPPRERIRYPRTYSGRQLAMLAFPLGGIGTGSIGLGGRGQLRDWEIYNRPDIGRAPQYGFASIWVRSGNSEPMARVLEARLMPPYAGADGLGSAHAPGLSRLEGAIFSGEFPMARIAFQDSRLPVQVSLEAFSPFIPLDPESSGYPAAVLRYRVRNRRSSAALVSIAFSLDHMAGPASPDSLRRAVNQGKSIEFRSSLGSDLQGLYMTDRSAPEDHPEQGTFALSLLRPGAGKVTYLRGWPNAKWWASPMMFWDDFTADGQLGPEAEDRKLTGSLCLQREIGAGAEAEYTFLLSWHFPNRTPEWSGWTAPKGREKTNLGNYYCTRFTDAWDAAEQLTRSLPELERRTRSFIDTMRASTLPGALRDAAMSNLSTLVTQTSFRTADGEFHGFEGCSDHRGCCFGNCTHVWNYETATQFLFPALARSLRKAAFGYSQDDRGGMRFRQMLPDGIDRFGYAAADGQMGQIVKTYLDWRLSGDTDWLRGYWPKIQKALSFAWIPGGWDPDRDGVMTGVQHNTYDVEFYGPNPLCGIYYLAALRAAEEMARVLKDDESARTYRALFEKGRAWIDANLFNGEYYIQKIHSIPKNRIDPTTVGDMGADHPEAPEFQLGDGCLADQLIGQYLAHLAGLGPLLDPGNIRKTLAAIHKYNYRSDLYDYDSFQRTYALNDESVLLVCDYGKGGKPKVPFPYYAEAWTGIEYLVATQFITEGMLREGLETIENVRRRYDGERRNPWDEPECGHHYARALSSWSTLIAITGFHYHGADQAMTLAPRLKTARFASFWSMGAGWGFFSVTTEKGLSRTEVRVTEGSLPLRSIRLG